MKSGKAAERLRNEAAKLFQLGEYEQIVKLYDDLNKSDLGYKNTHGCDCVVSAKSGDVLMSLKKPFFLMLLKTKTMIKSLY